MISILLENIRSLHNVGSVFRTADGVGVGKIFLTGITATPLHKDISKVALGAEEEISWEYFADPVKAIKKFRKESEGEGRNPFIIACEITKDAILYTEMEIRDNSSTLVVLGNENSGISKEILDIADIVVKIPMYGMKESLNVSVSAGIILYELKKIINSL